MRTMNYLKNTFISIGIFAVCFANLFNANKLSLAISLLISLLAAVIPFIFSAVLENKKKGLSPEELIGFNNYRKQNFLYSYLSVAIVSILFLAFKVGLHNLSPMSSIIPGLFVAIPISIVINAICTLIKVPNNSSHS